VWENRVLLREQPVDIQAGLKNQDFFGFLTDSGNLEDNSGSFHLTLSPTAWGNLPPLPVATNRIGIRHHRREDRRDLCLRRRARGRHCIRLDLEAGPQDSRGWTEVPVVGSRPVARSAHAAIYDPNPGGVPG